MLRAYRYIYYRIYAWNLRAWGQSDLPQFNACLGLGMLTVVNLLSALILTGVAAPPRFKISIVVFYVLSVVAHYWYFVRTRRYANLEEEFNAQPMLAPRPGLLFVWGYVLGSLGVFFGLLVSRLAPPAV